VIGLYAAGIVVAGILLILAILIGAGLRWHLRRMLRQADRLSQLRRQAIVDALENNEVRLYDELHRRP
jgi:uncharacterized protein HemX